MSHSEKVQNRKKQSIQNSIYTVYIKGFTTTNHPPGTPRIVAHNTQTPEKLLDLHLKTRVEGGGGSRGSRLIKFPANHNAPNFAPGERVGPKEVVGVDG